MSTPIKPLADNVVAVREKAPEKTASGIFLPDGAREKPVAVNVVAIGPDVKNVKVGDKIIYKADYDSVTELKNNDTEYIIVKEENVLATV